MSTSRRWVALVALAATLTLSACSAAAPTPAPKPTADSHVTGQSAAAAACEVLGQSVSVAASAMSSISTDMTKNPAKANAELQALSDAFDSGLKGVQNAKVYAAGVKAEGSLKLMAAELVTVKSNPTSAEAAKLVTDATAFEQDFDALATLCG